MGWWRRGGSDSEGAQKRVFWGPPGFLRGLNHSSMPWNIKAESPNDGISVLHIPRAATAIRFLEKRRQLGSSWEAPGRS